MAVFSYLLGEAAMTGGSQGSTFPCESLPENLKNEKSFFAIVFSGKPPSPAVAAIGL